MGGVGEQFLDALPGGEVDAAPTATAVERAGGVEELARGVGVAAEQIGERAPSTLPPWLWAQRSEAAASRRVACFDRPSASPPRRGGGSRRNCKLRCSSSISRTAPSARAMCVFWLDQLNSRTGIGRPAPALSARSSRAANSRRVVAGFAEHAVERALGQPRQRLAHAAARSGPAP